jgi:hypothetical protein
MVQGGDGHDGVIRGSRQRVLPDVGEDAGDVGRHYFPGLVNHDGRPVEGVDVIGPRGEFHGERPGTTADIEDPAAGTR